MTAETQEPSALGGRILTILSHIDGTLASLTTARDAVLDLIETFADRGYCEHCGRGDCSPSADQYYRQYQRADQAEARISAALTYLDNAHANHEVGDIDDDLRAILTGKGAQ